MDKQLENIELVVSDFDGVMTDNRVFVNEMGKEMVCVSRADGQAVHMLRAMGIDLAIISSESNSVVQKRAEKLKVECIQNVSDKAECLKKYCIEKSISLQNVAYIGNDINDYEAMEIVGVKIVPQDAYKEVKEIADCITVAKGGYGVIREVADLLIDARNKNGLK